MWSCCSTVRKQTFKFEHGTMVKAADPFRAIDLLRSISLKNVKVETFGDECIINFHPNVFIRLEVPDQERARRAAEWFAYLDRRELNIVGTA